MSSVQSRQRHAFILVGEKEWILIIPNTEVSGRGCPMGVPGVYHENGWFRGIPTLGNLHTLHNHRVFRTLHMCQNAIKHVENDRRFPWRTAHCIPDKCYRSIFVDANLSFAIDTRSARILPEASGCWCARWHWTHWPHALSGSWAAVVCVSF